MRPTLAEHRLLRLVTLTALYVAQGLPWGFATIGYTLLLTDAGYDNTTIGATVGLCYLPWSFKIAWGPLLDAVPALRVGRRRPFIVGAELLMGLTLLSLVWLDPRTELTALAVVVFLNNTFASLQDVAVDGLAVDILREDERGFANSLMWAGKSGGIVAGGGGGVLIAKYASYDVLFVVLAVLVWAIMLLPLLFRERPVQPDDREVDSRLLRLAWFLVPLGLVGVLMYGLSELEAAYAGESWVFLVSVLQPLLAVGVAIGAWPLVDRAGFRALRESFSFATPWWGVAVGVLTPAGYALTPTVMTTLLRADLKISEEGIATITGVVEPAAGVVGALIGGFLADRVGVRQTIAGAMVWISATLLAWAVLPGAWDNWWFLVGWYIAYNLGVFAYNAATLGLFMSIANPRISATHFAIFMVSTNMTYAITTPLAGVIADRAGIVDLFVIATIVQVVTVFLVFKVDPRRAAHVYGAAPAPR